MLLGMSEQHNETSSHGRLLLSIMTRLKTITKSVFIFCLLFCGILAKHELYDGHALYQIEVRFADEIRVLQELENNINIDVWSHTIPDRPGQILVPKEHRETFENALNDAGIQYRIEVENIKEKLDLEDQLIATATRISNSTSSRLSFDTIHSYEIVDEYLVELGRRYSDRVTVVSAGRSFEGRDIKYLKISTTDFQDTSKPIIMIESLLHCREWVSLPATLYAINKLVVDVTESDLVENIDWIILPVANPDGYEWTHNNARFWRKNRRNGLMIGNICLGVDLNRNFNIFWGTASSNNVCSDTYHGHGPFSEPETAIIRDILTEYSDRMQLFIDVHSFGSMILFGYGNGILPPNALTINLVGVRMAQTIDAVKWESNRDYIVGNIAMVLYDASGGASDYATAVGVPLAYTYELPAYRNIYNTLNGFLVDPDFIEQAGYETWEGIKVGARSALGLWRQKSNNL